MKITQVSLTLFAWDGIPPTSYHASSKAEGGSSALGLLRIGTDAGIEGHAFLGSAMHTAANDGPGLIRFLKPVLMGRDALDREAINAALWPWSRIVSTRSIGAVDVALWDIAGKAAGLPSIKIPERVLTMDSLPKNAVGKIAKRAVAEIATSGGN